MLIILIKLISFIDAFFVEYKKRHPLAWVPLKS